MKLFDLDACPALPIEARRTGGVRVTGNRSSLRARRQSRFPAEVWTLSFVGRTPTEAQVLVDLMRAVGYSGAVRWTPPDEAAPRVFRMGDFRQSVTSGTVHNVTFSLTYNPAMEP